MKMREKKPQQDIVSGGKIYMEARKERRHTPKGKGFKKKQSCREEEWAAKSLAPGPSPGHPFPGKQGGSHATYLLCSDHGDDVHSLLPYHLPEVVACVWQRSLSCNVVPFCPTNHHLKAKKSISKGTPRPEWSPVHL
jgi:hypothetical protein